MAIDWGSSVFAQDAVHPIHGHHEILRSESFKPEGSTHFGEGDLKGRQNHYSRENPAGGKDKVTITHAYGSKARGNPIAHVKSENAEGKLVSSSQAVTVPSKLRKQIHNASYR